MQLFAMSILCRRYLVEKQKRVAFKLENVICFLLKTPLASALNKLAAAIVYTPQQIRLPVLVPCLFGSKAVVGCGMDEKPSLKKERERNLFVWKVANHIMEISDQLPSESKGQGDPSRPLGRQVSLHNRTMRCRGRRRNVGARSSFYHKLKLIVSLKCKCTPLGCKSDTKRLLD